MMVMERWTSRPKSIIMILASENMKMAKNMIFSLKNGKNREFFEKHCSWKSIRNHSKRSLKRSSQIFFAKH